LPLFAGDGVESPDPELTPEKSAWIDDQKSRSDAAVCGPDPGLGVSKGQGKGSAKSG
jgi:hypothetical protein